MNKIIIASVLSLIAATAQAGVLGDTTNNIGQGGSVLGSGNSTNANANTNVIAPVNTNAQGQLQGQQQGQQQGQGQLQGQVATGGNATGGNSSSSSRSGVENSGNASQSQSTNNANNAAQTTNVGGQTASNSNTVGGQTTSTSVSYEAAKNPVSMAYAAPMSFSSDTCFASASAGGQGMTFGMSLGLPFKDKACETRANARTLFMLGEREAAVIYLSRDPAINAAVTEARTRK